MVKKLGVAAAWMTGVCLAVALLRPAWGLADRRGAPRYFPPDLMQFYFAGKLAASGQIAHLYRRPAYQPLVQEMAAQGERICAWPFNRPPFVAFLCIPLSWAPYRTALLAATFGNLVLLGILVWVLPRWFPLPRSFRACLLAFLPFLLAIGLGQDTLLLTLLAAFGFHLALQGKEIPAGLALGLCAFKPDLLWALPLGLLAAGKRRALCSFLVAVAALAACSVAAVGVGGIGEWFEVLRAPSTDYRPESMANLRALRIHLGSSAGLAGAAAATLSFGLILRWGRSGEKLAASILAALLFSPHTYAYDLSMAAPAIALAGAPAARFLVLLPWPYLFLRQDHLLLVFVLLGALGALAWRVSTQGGQQERQPDP